MCCASTGVYDLTVVIAGIRSNINNDDSSSSSSSSSGHAAGKKPPRTRHARAAGSESAGRRSKFERRWNLVSPRFWIQIWIQKEGDARFRRKLSFQVKRNRKSAPLLTRYSDSQM